MGLGGRGARLGKSLQAAGGTRWGGIESTPTPNLDHKKDGQACTLRLDCSLLEKDARPLQLCSRVTGAPHPGLPLTSAHFQCSP